jgi:hypothetical protein
MTAHDHHEACCTQPDHASPHAAAQILLTATAILMEILQMNAATQQILAAMQDNDLKVQHLFTLVDGVLTQLSDLNVTIANMGLSQADADTLLNATKKMGAEIDAEIAKIPATGTGANPPAETLTGFQITPQLGIDFTPNSHILVEIVANGPAGPLSLYSGPIVVSTDEPDTHAPYSFTAKEAAEATHVDMVTFTKPGPHVITVADTAKGISSFITVNVVANVVDPLPPNDVTLALMVTGPIVAGQNVDFTVVASSSTYLGTIGFTSDNEHMGLPPQYTFKAGDGGAHAFQLFHVPPAATISVTATDTVNPGTTGSVTVVVPAL